MCHCCIKGLKIDYLVGALNGRIIGNKSDLLICTNDESAVRS